MTKVEEEEYPQFYYLKPALDPKDQSTPVDVPLIAQPPSEVANDAVASSDLISPKVELAARLTEGHHVYAENRKGVSYDKLFGPYFDGASRIIVTDPYIRLFYQHRNMMEFVEVVIRRKPPEDQVVVHLVTGPDEGNISRQREMLESITTACTGASVDFSWAFDTSGTAHARDVVTDSDWKIVLDRGLDIFQPPIKTGGFSLGDLMQVHRMIKWFYVTYVRLSD